MDLTLNEIDELVDRLIELKNENDEEAIKEATSKLTTNDKDNLLSEFATAFFYDSGDLSMKQLTKIIKRDFYL